jgi:hypothetical protein
MTITTFKNISPAKFKQITDTFTIISIHKNNKRESVFTTKIQHVHSLPCLKSSQQNDVVLYNNNE